jgi:hypothetical protein
MQYLRDGIKIDRSGRCTPEGRDDSAIGDPIRIGISIVNGYSAAAG